MLIRKIEKFLRLHDIPPTRFGRLAVHDPRFVLDLRNGRCPRENTAKKVEHFMNIYAETARAGDPASPDAKGGAHE